MALLKYFTKVAVEKKEIVEQKKWEKVNEVKKFIEDKTTVTGRGKCKEYIPEQQAKIGKYAGENGPARTARHLSVPESKVRRLKAHYLKRLSELREQHNENQAIRDTVQ